MRMAALTQDESLYSSNPELLGTPSIISHSTICDWICKATGTYNMFPGQVDEIKHIIRDDETELLDEHHPDPKLVTSLASKAKFQNKELRITARLHSAFLLARTFSPDDEVIFTVLDESRIGHIAYEFTWDLTFYWSNFGFRRDAGFWPVAPQFCCCVNSNGTRVVIIGPPDLPGGTIPTTKILDCNSWNIKVLYWSGLPTPVPLWPVCIKFDPRGNSDRLTMICTDAHRPGFTPSLCIPSTLIQFDASQDLVTTMRHNLVLSGFLKYLKEGFQFMCLLHRDDGVPQKTIGIFRSDTADLLFVINFDNLELSTRWDYVRTYLIPMYSGCHRFLSIVLWMKNVQKDSIISDVVTLKMPYVGDMLPTLRHACRAAIICSLSKDNFHGLPLPRKLVKYVML